MTLPIILQLAGIFIIILEIIIPSGGLLSIIALILFGYSIYIVFTSISIDIGVFFILADIVLIPVLVIFGLKMLSKSRVTLRKTLSKEEGVISQSNELEAYLNISGRAITDLRPAGMALISNKKVDVVTRGEYIEADEEIIVYNVTGNQVIVKKKNRH